jgi:hypothetical protein
MNLEEQLRQDMVERIKGEMESKEIPGLFGGVTIYWKPMRGTEQKSIQALAEISTADGICAHVKMRARDKDGNLIFKDVAQVGMMDDYDFEQIFEIFSAITGSDLTAEEVKKK